MACPSFCFFSCGASCRVGVCGLGEEGKCLIAFRLLPCLGSDNLSEITCGDSTTALSVCLGQGGGGGGPRAGETLKVPGSWMV